MSKEETQEIRQFQKEEEDNAEQEEAEVEEEEDKKSENESEEEVELEDTKEKKLKAGNEANKSSIKRRKSLYEGFDEKQDSISIPNIYSKVPLSLSVIDF